MGRLILILGGARSGKSDFAQRLALEVANTTNRGQDADKMVLFVATAEPLDEEMAARIALHRQQRPAGWITQECPLHVGAALNDLSRYKAVVIDCWTLLVSNVLLSLETALDPTLAQAAVDQESLDVLNALVDFAGTCIVVSNEVGWGIVPESPLVRLYRDLLGRAHRQFAAVADAVYLLVAGLPIEIKSLAKPS